MDRIKENRGKKPLCWKAWFWHIVLILYVCFIYSNSMRPAVQSSAESGRVLKLLQKLASDAGIAVPWLTEHIVRKCAHFIEYTGLGILLRQSAACIKNQYVSEIYRAAIFAIPFIDETIQLFTEGRSGQISDVWLDMAGVLTGTFIYLTVHRIYLGLKRSQLERHEQTENMLD